MSDVCESLVNRRLFRNAAMIAVVVPAVLAGCAPHQAAPPPPQPAFAPAPPPPPPAPVPAPRIRGERG